MKLLSSCFFAFSILSLSFILSCRHDPEPEDNDFMTGITEKRYNPKDSLTVWYKYNPDSLLIYEQNSYGSSIKVFNNASEVPDGWKHFKLFQYNEAGLLITKTVFEETGGRKGVMWSDSLIYTDRKITYKLTRDHNFYPDGAVVSFPTPLWTTKSNYLYNNENRVSRRVDSVFIGHDISPEGLVVSVAQRFVFVNRTDFIYSENGEVSSEITPTFLLPNLKYSNGSDALISFPNIAPSGKTVFNYEYDDKGRLIFKKAAFTDARDGKTYISSFAYQYSSN